MDELMKVENYNGFDVVSTYTIAEHLGIQHKSILETIDTHKSVIESNFGLLAFETDSKDQKTGFGVRRVESRFVYLTEDQSIFLATLSRNTQQVIQLKANLVKSFQEAKRLHQKAVSTFNTPTTFAEALRLAADQQEEIERLQDKVKILEPKSEYADKVLLSESDFTTTDIAAELNMSAVRLNSFLCYKQVQRKHDGRYVLYQKYAGKGYTTTRTMPYEKSDGTKATKRYMVWTEQGRKLIHFLLNEDLSWSQPGKKKSKALITES